MVGKKILNAACLILQVSLLNFMIDVKYTVLAYSLDGIRILQMFKCKKKSAARRHHKRYCLTNREKMTGYIRLILKDSRFRTQNI